jgi:hypothetical protein
MNDQLMIRKTLTVGRGYLHLRPAILEPELDLPGLQPQLPAQLHPLVLVRVRALLEHPARTRRRPPFEQRKNPAHKTNEQPQRDEEGKGEIGSGHVRLELLNLARGVAVVSLLPVLAVGAVHDVVAEVHRVAARARLALALASDGGLLRAQSGEGTARTRLG